MRRLISAIITGIVLALVIGVISMYFENGFRSNLVYGASKIVITTNPNRYPFYYLSNYNYTNFNYEYKHKDLNIEIIIYPSVIFSNSNKVNVIIGIPKGEYNKTFYVLENSSLFNITISEIGQTSDFYYFNITLTLNTSKHGIYFIPVWDSNGNYVNYLVIIYQPGTNQS
jgi:hypothetical protein